MSNLGVFNPSPNIGKDGGSDPVFHAVMAGIDNSGSPKALQQDGSGNLKVAGSFTATSGGNATTGDNTITVTSAGTAVQLPNVSCKKVFVQAHESNGGAIAVGTSTVVAALAGRRGRVFFATQGDWFTVSNLNLLYIDSTVNGDKAHYYFEN